MKHVVKLWFVVAACATAFYREGAKVILCARREDELKRVKQNLLKLNTVGHTTFLSLFIILFCYLYRNNFAGYNLNLKVC